MSQHDPRPSTCELDPRALQERFERLLTRGFGRREEVKPRLG